MTGFGIHRLVASPVVRIYARRQFICSSTNISYATASRNDLFSVPYHSPCPSRRTFASTSMEALKELRTRSGAPIVECKKALNATDNNISAVMDWLREHG